MILNENLDSLLYFHFPLLRDFENAPGKAGEFRDILKKSAFSRPDNALSFTRKVIAMETGGHPLLLPVLEGIAYHVLWRQGYAETADGTSPDSVPDAGSLADFLQHAADTWPGLREKSRTFAEMLKICSLNIRKFSDAEKYLADLLRLANHRDPEPEKDGDYSEISLEKRSFGSVRGRAAEGTFLLTIGLLEKEIPFPPLLPSLLMRFATDSHPAVRVSVLRHLKKYAEYDPTGAWRIFHAVNSSASFLSGLWPWGESFLQGQCGADFPQVRYYLEQALYRNIPVRITAWAGILAEAFLGRQITVHEMGEGIRLFRNRESVETAFSVLCSAMEEPEKQAVALTGIQAMLKHSGFTGRILRETENLFRLCHADEVILQIFHTFLSEFKGLPESYDFSFFYEKLYEISGRKPLAVLQICEELPGKIQISGKQYRIWQGEKCILMLRKIIQEKRIRKPEIICALAGLSKTYRIPEK